MFFALVFVFAFYVHLFLFMTLASHSDFHYIRVDTVMFWLAEWCIFQDQLTLKPNVVKCIPCVQCLFYTCR